MQPNTRWGILWFSSDYDYGLLFKKQSNTRWRVSWRILSNRRWWIRLVHSTLTLFIHQEDAILSRWLSWRAHSASPFDCYMIFANTSHRLTLVVLPEDVSRKDGYVWYVPPSRVLQENILDTLINHPRLFSQRIRSICSKISAFNPRSFGCSPEGYIQYVQTRLCSWMVYLMLHVVLPQLARQRGMTAVDGTPYESENWSLLGLGWSDYNCASIAIW